MPQFKRPWKLGIGIFALIGLLLLAYLVFGTTNQGQIINSDTKKSRTTISDKQLDGKYITLTYAGGYGIKNITAKDADLEIYQLRAATTYDKQTAIIVSKQSLSQNSGYILRSTRSDVYTKRMVTTPTVSAEVWVRTDNQEQTAFITKGDKVATLAFTQRGGDPVMLAAEVDRVINSFDWR